VPGDETETLAQGPRAGERSLYGDVLATGALAGEYLIQRSIAAGGCGRVYVAQHRMLGRQAALKVLHRDLSSSAEMVERFVREARAANLIKHPNIVDIYDFGQLSDGRPYYVMELLEGGNLETWLRGRGRMAPPRALEVLEPICGALGAAHRAGIVHRDLKASNIGLSRRDDPRSVKLLDFGIAKLLDVGEPGQSGLTSMGRRLGTPHAMAPEQILGGRIDGRTDMYSLGVLLYQVLTGRYPFQSEDLMELQRMHLEEPPPRASEAAPVAVALDAVVLRCLAKHPDQRFEDVERFLEALRQAVVGARARGATAQSARAVAIYLETRMDAAGEEVMDDRLLDDLGAVLDESEQMVRGAGFLLPVQSGSALLAARLLGEDAAAERDRREAVELAVELHRRAVERTGVGGRLRVNVSVHVDQAVVRSSDRGSEIVGGGILRVTAWAPREDCPRPCVTAELLDGLPPELRTRVDVLPSAG
jgi:serine/threonine-protein kinase